MSKCYELIYFINMMNYKNSCIYLIAIACVVSCATSKKTTNSSANTNQVLQKMRLANEYFMNKWPDPGKETVTDKVRPSNIWTRAVYYEGLMALYEIDPQKKYYDYAVDWGQKHQWSPRGAVDTRNADNKCCGQTYID